MDIDELKIQLKNKLSTDHAARSQSDFAALLTNRTRSVIDKLKNSLWFEIYSCIIILLLSFISVS